METGYKSSITSALISSELHQEMSNHIFGFSSTTPLPAYIYYCAIYRG
jgi:hypothetical protein